MSYNAESAVENTKLIAKNTFFLYGRSLFTLLISLYTSRIVLNTLGISDFGIYNVVGGVVSMFSIISATLTTSTQRFITFELGKKSERRVREIFSVALNLHFVLALFILILMELIGVWFINNKLSLPYDRIIAANYVFQFSIITFVIDLISVPYNACIIAYEKMKAFAYIGMFESIMKLLIVYLLLIINSDKLVFYSLSILLLSILIRIIYGLYCRKNFPECKYVKVKDKGDYEKLLSFSGWNLIGTSSAILTLQGLNILLNLFWGISVNAARGLAVQIESAVTQLVNNFMISLNPQIIKSYSFGDYSYMMMLVERGSRFSFYLMMILAMPILIEVDYVLIIWLKQAPEYTAIFVRLTLIFSLMQTFSNTLITQMMATGKIKKYQITIGSVQMLNFPISYIFLKLGFPPYVIYLVTISNSVLCIGLRIFFVEKTFGVSMKLYKINVIFKSIIIFIIAIIVPYSFSILFSSSFFRLIGTTILSLLSCVSTIYLIGLQSAERNLILNSIKNKLTNN
jgi:O-antigen/teichoic acid export membrane protein